MSEIKIFKNEQFGEIRTAGTAENPLFCLADLCKALGIANARNVKSRLDKDDVHQMDTIDKLGRTQNVTYVTEDGMYDVIMRSDSPATRPFRKWVTHEVLPTIRKTGSYSIQQQQPPKTYIEALKALVVAEEEKERLALENKQAAEKVAVLEPKGKFFDTITKNTATISVEMASKVLNFKKAGRNNLYKIMRDHKMIDYENMPYQKYIERGMLVMGSQEFVKYGKPALRYVPKITHKGLEYLMELLIKLGYKQRDEYSDFNPYDIDFSKIEFFE